MADNNPFVPATAEPRKPIINVSSETADFYCSVKPQTEEEKIELYNLVNGDVEGKRIADMINLEIEVKDVYFEYVTLESDDPMKGEEEAPRCILITPDGTALNGTTWGITNSIEKAIQMFGEPTWEPARKFIVKQVPTKRGSMLKLVMVPPKAKK